MSDKFWSDGVSKTRSALGDVTNLVGKRAYSLISKSSVNTGIDYKKDDGLRFRKKECRTTENYKNENFQKEIVDCGFQPHSFIQIDSSSKPKVTCQIKYPCSPGVRHNADSDTTTRSSHDVNVETEIDERNDSEVVFKDKSKEQVETSISNNGDDLTFDNLDFSRLVASQESRSSGLERCIEQKGTNTDSIKTCSCSFCMKAAYIWSDLHYQDIKGRMAAIKKSQKEASILVQKNSIHNEINKYSKLESDLKDKWRSFFLHMEDIFVRESIQLDPSLLKLRVLREKCKSDLNPMDGMHFTKN